MRVTEGTCAHCGAYVFWSERLGGYVNAKDKSTACQPITEPHSVPEEP